MVARRRKHGAYPDLPRGRSGSGVVACEAGGRLSAESLRFVIIVSLCDSVLSPLLPPCACCPAKLAAPLLGLRFDKVHLLLRFSGPSWREFHTQLSPLDDALHDAGRVVPARSQSTKTYRIWELVYGHDQHRHSQLPSSLLAGSGRLDAEFLAL